MSLGICYFLHESLPKSQVCFNCRRDRQQHLVSPPCLSHVVCHVITFSVALSNIVFVISPSFEFSKHFISLLNFSMFYFIYQVFIHWASFILQYIQPLLSDCQLFQVRNYARFSTSCTYLRQNANEANILLHR